MANDRDDFFKLLAIERLVTWLAAKEVIRNGDPNDGLQRLSDELHALLDASQSPQPNLWGMQELVGANLDDLVQGVAAEVRRLTSPPKPS